MLDDCLRALRWRVGVAMLEVETGTVDMVYSSSQHCGGDGRGRRRGESKGSREVLE